MNRRAVIAFFPSAFLLGQKKKDNKGPEIELLEATAHVEDSRVNVDGRVKNVSERPVRKLNVVYEVLDGDRNVLTKQQGTIDAAVLDPGEEASFQSQMQYHARAVSFRLSFEDGGGRELRAEKTGPFPIE